MKIYHTRKCDETVLLSQYSCYVDHCPILLFSVFDRRAPDITIPEPFFKPFFKCGERPVYLQECRGRPSVLAVILSPNILKNSFDVHFTGKVSFQAIPVYSKCNSSVLLIDQV